MRTFSILLMGLLLLPATALAQLSAYGSMSYGFEANVLSNYLNAPDQLRQAYAQLSYGIPTSTTLFEVSYAGGLTMYRTLEERNFLEHGLRLRYQRRWMPAVQDATPSAQDEEESEEDSTDEETPSFDEDDPAASSVEFSVKPSARYDKAVFAEFNNTGVDGAAGYRFTLQNRYRILTQVVVTTRAYPNVPLLSNWVGGVLIGAEVIPQSEWRWGGSVTIGRKQYTQSAIDTSLFQVALSQSKGRGKGGNGNNGSSGRKRVLLQATSRSTWQWDLSCFVERRSPESVVRGEAGYRWNPTNAARRIGQDASGSLLTDDLYNDYFSSEGFDASTHYSTEIVRGVRGALTVKVEQKNFGTPALDVLGDVLASKRQDLRSTVEVGLSRSFPLSASVSAEIGITATAVRNQSNDEYNDFSASGISVSIGVGF